MHAFYHRHTIARHRWQSASTAYTHQFSVTVPCGSLIWPHTHTHTHNRFTALDFVHDYPGEQVPEKTSPTHNYCVTFAAQRVSLIVIPFCLSVCLSVGYSATYSLPRLIDHNHIWSPGIYTCPRTRVSLFRSPVSHTLGARGKNIQKFRLFPTHILATANVMLRAI